MRIICWQTILMKYHTLFFSKVWKDVAKFVVCCSRDWRFGRKLAHLLSPKNVIKMYEKKGSPATHCLNVDESRTDGRTLAGMVLLVLTQV